jgi:hypothetical protein
MSAFPPSAVSTEATLRTQSDRIDERDRMRAIERFLAAVSAVELGDGAAARVDSDVSEHVGRI